MPIPEITTVASMDTFWQSHMYLLYITTTCAVVYIVWTLKLWKAIIESGLKEIRDNHQNLEKRLSSEYIRIDTCEKVSAKTIEDMAAIKIMLDKILYKLNENADYKIIERTDK
jgi:hypothetical protein